MRTAADPAIDDVPTEHSTRRDAPAKHRHLRLALKLGVFALLVGLVVAAASAGLAEPERLAAIGSFAGPWTPAVVIGGVAVLVMVFAPRTGLAAAAGAVFGPVPGTLYVLAGAVLGAAAAFALGRLLGRDAIVRLTAASGERRWARRLLAGAERLEATVKQPRRAFVAVVVTRMLPMVPFGGVNYAFALTSVRTWIYVPATALAIAPSTMFYAVAGSATTRPHISPWLLVAGASGLVAAVAAGWFVRRRAVESPA